MTVTMCSQGKLWAHKQHDSVATACRRTFHLKTYKYTEVLGVNYSFPPRYLQLNIYFAIFTKCYLYGAMCTSDTNHFTN